MGIVVKTRRKQHNMHPNSLKNLRPFQKGNQANPLGRPRKDVSLTSLLKEEIEKIPEGEKEGRTWRQLLVLAWLSGSLKNPFLFREMLDRLEGKVAVPIQIDIQAEAEKLAKEMNLPVAEIVRQAEEILAGH